ncbi:YTH domain [Macleaya cordata]|uniref:YTH domain-containing family protein n=1 Tax=Macleaya cordata TaxID=56857 RepID=A0A200R8I5_MACCD|nr:YTH domain [Macleaya cordata]
MDTGLKSASVANLAKQNVVSGKDGSQTNLTSSISSSRYAISNMKGETNQVRAAEQSVYYPPTYGYYYPGFDGAYTEWDDHHYFHAGNGSEIPYSVPQLGIDFQSSAYAKGCYPMGKFNSFSNQQGLFPNNGYMYYRPNARNWACSDRFRSRERFNRNGEFEASSELNRGPRARKVNTSVEKDQFVLTVQRDKYNLQEFSTDYENAKFFVIKSYSEDDIHKSIKYGVWTSTANGNKKLDAAFRDAEMRSGEMCKRSPIFLFFSVNGSGQFVGLAEMIGQVDFKKDMDFWQQDKWNGFFPVQWHIIKDIPNVQLRHIILENNDNKPVTNSRDTQEIGFKQGSEMLTIFKSFSTKTSMLDDFNFYEDREKLLLARRSSKTALSQEEIDRKNEFPKHLEAGVRKIDEASMKDQKTSDAKTASLIELTKSLSLNPLQPKNIAKR